MNRSLIIAAAVLMLVTCAFAQSDSHPECGNAVFFGGAERGATSTSSDASLLDGFNTVMERVSASKRWFVWMKVTVHDFNLIDGQDPLFTLGSSEGQDVQFALNPVGSFSWQQRHEDRLYSNRASSLQDALRAGEEVDLVFEVVYDYNTAATAFVNGADITTRRHRSPAEYVLSSNPTITLNGKASNAFTIHDSAMFTDMVLNDFLDCANGIPPTAFVAGATATVDSWGLAYGRVWNMDAADMDNDGDLDLVVVRYGANGVSPKMIVIYVNDNGSFSSENVVVVDSNIGRASIRFYDYNNDRNIDIVAGSRTDNKVVRYTNNGDLSFTATVLREFDNPVMDIAITENSPNALVLNEGVFEFREGTLK